VGVVVSCLHNTVIPVIPVILTVLPYSSDLETGSYSRCTGALTLPVVKWYSNLTWREFYRKSDVDAPISFYHMSIYL
jgi:hypothetical protein